MIESFHFAESAAAWSFYRALFRAALPNVTTCCPVENDAPGARRPPWRVDLALGAPRFRAGDAAAWRRLSREFAVPLARRRDGLSLGICSAITSLNCGSAQTRRMLAQLQLLCPEHMEAGVYWWPAPPTGADHCRALACAFLAVLVEEGIV